jgi:CheY-like chemotaxis protein
MEAWRGLNPFGHLEEGVHIAQSRSAHVLLVEDNPADALLAAELINETGIPSRITTVSDGEMAISTLQNLRVGDSNFPELILLDINLPKKNGHEVLKFIRDAHLANAYVAIYTGSSSPEDERNAAEHGADAYIIKPIGSKEMERTIVKFREILNHKLTVSSPTYQ